MKEKAQIPNAQARALRVPPWRVRCDLERLRDDGHIDLALDEPALFLRVEHDEGETTDAVRLADALHGELSAIETANVAKLELAHDALCCAADERATEPERAAQLEKRIDAYFDADADVTLTARRSDEALSEDAPARPAPLFFATGARAAVLRKHARAALDATFCDPRLKQRDDATVAPELLQDDAYLARAAARLLHGLNSPAFQATEWRDSPFWGRHAETPFETIRAIALDARAERGLIDKHAKGKLF